MIVLDASLAAKLVIEEADSLAAKRWFLELVEDVVAPDLIAIEVAQAIVRRVNVRTTAPEIGRTALRAWQGMLSGGGRALTRAEPAQVVAGAEIAIRLGHPVKDCLYLALAMQLNCDLVTSDARFADKARTVYPGIRLLDVYGLDSCSIGVDLSF